MRNKRSRILAISLVFVLALAALAIFQGYPAAFQRPASSSGQALATSAASGTSASGGPQPVPSAAPQADPRPGSDPSATAPGGIVGSGSAAAASERWPSSPTASWPIQWPKSDPLADMGLTRLDKSLPDPRRVSVPDSIQPYRLPTVKGLDTRWIPKGGLAAGPGYTGPTVYLTFDDGPNLRRTPQILAILKAYGVPATFFMLGTHITPPLYPLVWRCQLEGHAIGNHTYDHGSDSQSSTRFRQSVALTSEIIRQITGYRPTLFRFPGGSSSYTGGTALKDGGLAWLADNGYQYFDWDTSTGDGNGAAGYSAAAIVSNVFAHVASGKSRPHDVIVLAHDSPTSNDTVGALPLLIRKFAERGYRFGVLTADGYTTQFNQPKTASSSRNAVSVMQTGGEQRS